MSQMNNNQVYEFKFTDFDNHQDFEDKMNSFIADHLNEKGIPSFKHFEIFNGDGSLYDKVLYLPIRPKLFVQRVRDYIEKMTTWQVWTDDDIFDMEGNYIDEDGEIVYPEDFDQELDEDWDKVEKTRGDQLDMIIKFY